MTTTPTTRLSKWADDIRAIKDATNTPEHKRRAMNHLQEIVAFNNAVFYTGFFFSLLDVSYVFPWIMMGLSISSHWTTVSHHVSHGGYNATDHATDHATDATNTDATDGNIAKNHKYNRFTYGVKLRRFFDWMDYILPEAWSCEHNIYHHYMLNEYNDPDNVQHNLVLLRTMNAPRIVKYGIIAFFALTWRLFYYSSNSYKYYKATKLNYTMKDEDYKQMTLFGMVTNEWPSWISKVEYFTLVLCPIILYRAACFAIIYTFHAYFPAIFTSTHLCNVILNYIMADLFCNVHTFAIIVPNHSGSDMYLYRTPVKGKSDEWLLRQCISSANYTSANNATDYLQGWLNYQIEHHLFPDLSAYEYQLMRKDVVAVCRKHGVPYVCENVFIRLWKTVKIMTGQESIPYYDGSEMEKYMNEAYCG
jgi:fatty acid desaturase